MEQKSGHAPFSTLYDARPTLPLRLIPATPQGAAEDPRGPDQDVHDVAADGPAAHGEPAPAQRPLQKD